jgi:hypothetical protein
MSTERDAILAWLSKHGRGRPANTDEMNVAVAVEQERLKRGIPATQARTPEDIFAGAAKKYRVSKRSAEGYYAKHRKRAQWLAYNFSASRLDEWNRLSARYGDGIPLRAVQPIQNMEAKLKPSEMPRFEDSLRDALRRRSRILARKSKKPAK